MNCTKKHNDIITHTSSEGKRCLAVLGSTGSIGTQTLDIVEEYPDRFEAYALTARSQWQLLAEQARKYGASYVAIAEERHLPALREALADLPIRVEGGSEAVGHAATLPEVDMVVTALVGYSGLLPTVEAIRHGKTIALANKETLVAGGPVIERLLAEYPEARIIPVDSEHSAIYQCLVGESTREARKIYLTASGGPFRTLSREEMERVTVRDALRHPNWDMGAKVTIDSASMMNKGFEMIEAHWLFSCPPECIEVVVHPQSIVHSMVEFNDGSVKAQLGSHSMHLPIRYALGYPERLATEMDRMTLSMFSNLTFEAPDFERFPLLGYAFDAIRAGGNMPCILNAANEVAVAAFLREEIPFMKMPEIAAHAMGTTQHTASPTLDDIIATHAEATAKAQEALRGIKTVK